MSTAATTPGVSTDGELHRVFQELQRDWRSGYATVGEYGEERLKRDLAGSIVAFGVRQYSAEQPRVIFLGSAWMVLLESYEREVLGGVPVSKAPPSIGSANPKTLLRQIIDRAWGAGSFDYLTFQNSRSSLTTAYPKEKAPAWSLASAPPVDRQEAGVGPGEELADCGGLKP